MKKKLAIVFLASLGAAGCEKETILAALGGTEMPGQAATFVSGLDKMSVTASGTIPDFPNNGMPGPGPLSVMDGSDSNDGVIDGSDSNDGVMDGSDSNDG